MPDPLTIEIKGLDVLLKAFEKFPKEIARGMSQAGHEAANEVLDETVGLRDYPPETDANMPRTIAGTNRVLPWYQRGYGTRYIGGGGRKTSENLGKQWYVKREGYKARIGNRASYAKYVHGDDTQAKAMAKIGWKKLFATFEKKKAKITKIYQEMVDRTIAKLGL